jgi:hypothetical protein
VDTHPLRFMAGLRVKIDEGEWFTRPCRRRHTHAMRRWPGHLPAPPRAPALHTSNDTGR